MLHTIFHTTLIPSFMKDRQEGWLRRSRLSFAKTSAAGQVIDLSPLILTQSRLDGHSPAPPAPSAPVLLRRPPPARDRGPCPASATRRVQEDGDPARLRTTDRRFWVGLARAWTRWRQPLVIVTPDTVLRWQRCRFRAYWTRLSARPIGARPPGTPELKTPLP